jgi:protein-S-isoprenylcysteine O-methyltransferase Ste14
MLKLISILGLLVMGAALIGLFACGGIVVHWSWLSVALGVALFGGGLVRMLCEERLLRESYPEYIGYARVTKRMLPYVF